jgi:hypothetical protein
MSSGNLSGGYNMGGATVYLAGDTSKLRAAVAEAKTIVADVSKIVANIGFKIDIQKAQGELRAATANVQLRLPVELDFTNARAQLAAFQNQMRIAMPGGGGGPGPGPGSNGVAVGGGTAAGGRGGGLLRMGTLRGVSTVGVAMEANRLITGNEEYKVAQILADNDQGKQLQLMLDRRREMRSGYLTGIPTRIVEGLRYGHSFGIGGTESNKTSEELEQEIAHIQVDARKIDARTEQMRMVGDRQKAAISESEQLQHRYRIAERTVGKTSAESRVVGAEESLSEFDKKMEQIPRSGRIAEIGEGRKALVSEVKLAEKEAATAGEQEIRDSQRRIESIVSEGADARLRLTKGSLAAENEEFRRGLNQEIQSQRDAVATLQAAGASQWRVGLAKNQLAAESASANERIAAREASQLRDSQQAATAISGETRVIASHTKGTQLSAAGQGRAAMQQRLQTEYEQINAKYQPQIQAMEDKYGKVGMLYKPDYNAMIERRNAEVARAKAESQADQVRLGFEDKQFAVTTGSRIVSANLRIGNNPMAADLVDFDAETKNRLASMRAPGSTYTGEQIKAEQDARLADRALLVKQQKEDLSKLQYRLDARSKAAYAQGQGFEHVAAVAERIGDMKSELIGAPAQLRPRIEQTQIAEIKAIEQEMTRPRNYAGSFDPRHDVTGGPSGMGGTQELQVLNMMAGYLKELTGLLNKDTAARFN